MAWIESASRSGARLALTSQGVYIEFAAADFADAGIAQLVEHDLAKVGVASSSLVSRSKFKKLQNRVSELGNEASGIAAKTGAPTLSQGAG